MVPTTPVKFGKTDPRVYSNLTTDNPIDLTRWQVVNCYAGRIGLINSGGEAKGTDDLAGAVRTAVINKRAGGQGLILGRKAFQRPIDEGAALVHAVQDVYLDQCDHRSPDLNLQIMGGVTRTAGWLTWANLVTLGAPRALLPVFVWLFVQHRPPGHRRLASRVSGGDRLD